MRRTPCLLAFATAAGLLVAAPATPAHAQVSYGYDSLFYNLPASAGYWYGSGYNGMYTDPTTATFAEGTNGPLRSMAPYGQPPYATFSRTDGLSAALNSNTTAAAATTTRPAVTRAPAQPTTVRATPRRGLFGRVRGRR